MTQKKSRTQIASAVSLALSSMMLSAGLNAGVIKNSNDTATQGLCSVVGQPTVHGACIGAWNLGNAFVELVKADDITAVFGSFDEDTGAYSAMTYGDSFRSYITERRNTDLGGAGATMARISGKDWPVGEPTGIKAIIDDAGVTNGNPQNCIINTSYLDGLNDSDKTTDLDAYLDSTNPEPVICSSGFQTHKRFKIAMLDTTVVDTVNIGDAGKPIDVVFNVADDGKGLRLYQVFSKINNYTGKRLNGYMIQVGKGVGAEFKTASELGITDRLQLSRGIGDYLLDATTTPPTYDPNQNLWTEDQMATYSSGLFGRADKHFPTDGFFDNEAAGFLVGEGCTTSTDLVVKDCAANVSDTDTLRSTGPLNAATSFYYTYFGDWPHQNLTPRGVFFDTDGDPTTDADLVAWWNGTQWMKPDNLGTVSTPDTTPSVFVPVSATELSAWANDRSCYANTKSCYSVGIIEDVLNLGLNYVVKVGDGIADATVGSNTDVPEITVRIIPVVGDQSQAAPWTTNLPAEGDLTATSVPVSLTSSGGGGCAVGGNGRFDPTLPALLAMGLGFFGWRRFKAGK